MTTTVDVSTVLGSEGRVIGNALEEAYAELAKVKSQRIALYFTLLKDACEGIFGSEKKLLAKIARLEADQARVGSLN
jgi:hypothetical protein